MFGALMARTLSPPRPSGVAAHPRCAGFPTFLSGNNVPPENRETPRRTREGAFMNRRCGWGTGTLAAALLASPAVAETPRVKAQPAPGFGASGLTVRSGVTTWSGNVGRETGVGAFLALLGEVPIVSGVGLELGYEGSANGYAEPRRGTLWRHNGGLLAKVGPTLFSQWKPFFGAGAGVSYFHPTPMDVGTAFEKGWGAEVPLAAGLEYRYSGVTAGLRATYRVLVARDFAPGSADVGNLFSADLSLGARF
ncbi:hypothetical protein BHS07_09410 [Myxococcus xanthus]|nr:hypothetical protein BHS07_09410 [Myxococcus xanthus]